MAHVWQTIEEAAITLGISARTLHRRITKGQVQTRLEHGRREVLVTVPDPEPVQVPAAGEASGGQSSAAQVPPVGHSADMADTALLLADDRLRRADLALSAFKHSAVTAINEVERVRRSSAIAWSTVGVLTAAVLVVSVWAAHRVTRADADVRHLSDEVRRLADTADKAQAMADSYRQQAVDAQLTAAAADGQLRATREAMARQPAAPPLSSVFGDVGWLLDQNRAVTPANAASGGRTAVADTVGR